MGKIRVFGKKIGDSKRWNSGDAVDGPPFRFGDRLDGQATALFQQQHLAAVRFGLQ
jgi:hypothetical protein